VVTIKCVRAFIDDEVGQDLIEYTLLLAFMVMASAAMFIGGGASINVIWTITNNNLSQAASVIGGS
jgi:Flp pilus assembly pilin Flp